MATSDTPPDSAEFPARTTAPAATAMAEGTGANAADGGLDSHFEPIDAEQWALQAEASLRDGQTLDDLARSTLDGLPVQAIYTSRPGSDSTSNTAVTEPSASPPSQWDNRLNVIGTTPALRQANALAGLEGGISSLHLKISDDAVNTHQDRDASGDTFTLSELSTFFAPVHLSMIDVSVDAGRALPSAADAMLELWETQSGGDASLATGSLNADPFRHAGNAIDQMSATLDDDVNVLVKWTGKVAARFPQVRTITVNTVEQHNAGASALTELISAIAIADQYLTAMIDAGLSPAGAARQLSFHTALSPDFLGGAVKLRALRRVWQHTLSHYSAEPAPIVVTAETSRRFSARREPWMNHLRHVMGSMAAAAGGADTLIVHPHNRVEDDWLDDEHALGGRLARNIAPMLQHESHLLNVIDPLAGSYAAETMTNTLCQAVWAGLAELQKDGGYSTALANGEWAVRIAGEHERTLANLLNGDNILIGVNRFTGDAAVEIDDAVIESWRTLPATIAFPPRRLADAFSA